VTENTRESDQNQGVKGDSVGCSTGIHTSNKCGQYVPRNDLCLSLILMEREGILCW
jgi:hypothetical protein